MAKHKKNNKKNSTKKSNQKVASTSAKTIKSQQKLEESTSNNQGNLLGWILAAFAAVLYFNTLGHQYAFDDYIVITGNSFTQQGFEGIYDLMTRDFFEGIYGEKGMDLTGGRYRPLSLVMFAIEQEIWPNNPAPGHFINVLFYALTALMLFKVLKNWLENIQGNIAIAFIATLLFVVHPIHTEAIANIKSRDEILGFLLVLVTLHGIYKVVREENRAWFPIALISFFLAMMSKENAFTYVALIPIALYVFQKKTIPEAFKISIPFIFVAGLYIILRTYMLYKVPIPGVEMIAENPDIMENPFVGADPATRLATVGVILLHYVLLLFVPHPMSADYSFNQIPWTTFADPMALLGWGIYIAMGVYTAIAIWKKDVVAFGFLLYLAPLSLVCNLFFNIGAPMADRFLYFPSFGFCLIIAYLMVKWGKVSSMNDLKKNLPLVGVLALVTILFSYKTIDRNPDWKDNETLFTQDIHAAPNSAKIHYYYANTLVKKYLDPVLNDVKNPSPEALVWLDSAESGFLRSHQINPNFHHATYNLGLVNINKKNPLRARKWLKYTLDLQPHHGISHEQLVRVYGEFLNKPDSALYHLNLVLSTPEGKSHPSNYQHLGILNAMKGNVNEAEAAFRKAAEMDKNMAKGCYTNLSGMFQNMANVAKAQNNPAKETEYSQKAQAYAQMAAQAN